MARLYLLSPDLDFNARPTSEIFPRNAQNEAFVHNLIANGFEVDAAPALDSRYDGSRIYAENDVRAHIQDGRLLRIFGIVRNVGKHRIREERMMAELDEALVDILTALPPRRSRLQRQSRPDHGQPRCIAPARDRRR
ncbi:hypothetical protein [Breoghania sp.]|uniref:hypothetical protein n=1 Tax=Breoghania sp. TaxID=2065378 RepID=UPI00261D4D1E|nr:hypothetical protein [Breoghania sp.]MDJ0933391.1 hypothetical protein [Breoghania sp.]